MLRILDRLLDTVEERILDRLLDTLPFFESFGLSWEQVDCGCTLMVVVKIAIIGIVDREWKALWRKLIDAKYGRIKFSLSPKIPSKASVSPVWKKITDILHSRSPSGVVANKGLVHCVGKGNCTRFWDDHWVEGHILKNSFPRIFALAANKSGSVCDFRLWESGQWNWNVNIRRKLFD
ncbi:hypothetical protein CTI12_AA584640 [Artemisia annua]|uniref:RNA-directed DNA polymerase, eukaryota, Reverse transcriptase zinc-binding domain protein n=1 Tax=Artemisia annua TaxID=35608 RepID=A0A2U1KMW0_ARTAN|nr:hypothetical protein CTI12_AA584640 [Artemisia annua]